jgi:hypothetical protein
MNSDDGIPWIEPPSFPPSNKKKGKKKNAGRVTTSYSLPKLDEMVLLQPIATKSDALIKEEKTRCETANEALVKYNRWLAFVQPSKPGKNVRGAAMELQNSVHELNSFISGMMLQIDQKLANLQDQTESFVEAVQEEGGWQTTGDLLGERRSTPAICVMLILCEQTLHKLSWKLS